MLGVGRIGHLAAAMAALSLTVPVVSSVEIKAVQALPVGPIRRTKKAKAQPSRAWGRTTNLNRSRHHRFAGTYEDARHLAPAPHHLRPVR